MTSPTLAVRRTDGHRRRSCAAASASRIRSARWTARVASETGRAITNSSPPYRATRSSARVDSRITDGDFPQHIVAGDMPVAIVDLLEMIDIEHQDRHPDAACGVPLGQRRRSD